MNSKNNISFEKNVIKIKLINIVMVLILSACGVKGRPRPKETTSSPSLFDQYPDIKLNESDQKKGK